MGNRITTKESIGGMLIESSAIKAIIPGSSDPDSTSRMDRGLEIITNANEEFKKEKARLLRLTPQERAKDTNIAETLWLAIHNRRMTETERAVVIKKQETFFLANPTWAEAKPSCYLTKDDLSRRSSAIDTKADMLSIKDLVAGNVIDLMARQVSNSIA